MQTVSPPEKSQLTLGYIPLTDCAPLVVARERGYFARHGLSVTLSRENSWASLRDKVAVGMLDGAQMLAPMPLAASLGVGMPATPMITALSLDLNGNSITLSESLFQRLLRADPESANNHQRRARALARVLAEDRELGAPPLTFAMVYPVSSHHYLLRRWLASGGIDPDREVRIVVIPPPQMMEHLAEGTIDGYCVGEPWNTLAVLEGLGRVAITSHDLWPNHPEKVLGVHRDWAVRYPQTHQAMLRALLEAAQWLDDPANRREIAGLLAGNYLHLPLDALSALSGRVFTGSGQSHRGLPDYHVFYRYAATFPWQSHGLWWLAEMYRWGQLDRPLNLLDTVQQVYRPDLYRQAATALGLPCPTVDVKPEGINGDPWILGEATTPIAMGPDRALPGPALRPHHIMAYLSALGTGEVALQALADCNYSPSHLEV